MSSGLSFSSSWFHFASIFGPILHSFLGPFWNVVLKTSKLKSKHYLLCFEHIHYPKKRYFFVTVSKLFGTTFRHRVWETVLGRMWTTSAQFAQIWGLGRAPESGPRTHVLHVFSPLGRREAQEGSTTTPRGPPSLNSDRFCMIFE